MQQRGAAEGRIASKACARRIRTKHPSVTLRYRSWPTHAGTCVILLVHDLHVRVINASTGELLRELIIDPSKDYQPKTRKYEHPTCFRGSGVQMS